MMMWRKERKEDEERSEMDEEKEDWVVEDEQLAAACSLML